MDYANLAREMIETAGYPIVEPEHINSLAAFLAWFHGDGRLVEVRRDPALLALAADDQV